MNDGNREGRSGGMTPSATAKTLVDRVGLGNLAVDTARQRLGRVMGCYGTFVQLRPPMGGIEWDASPEYIRVARPDEILHVPTRELPS